MSENKICSVDECDSPVARRGFCNRHYLKWVRYGDPMGGYRNRTGITREHPIEYYTWKGIRSRCENPNDKKYKDYGGRGIKVCKRWSGIDGFRHFYEDIGDRPQSEHKGRIYSLDRIDVNGNYCPENCRWATPREQAKHKRDKRMYSEHIGVTYNKTHNLWQATLKFRGKLYAKWCKTEEEAIKERERLEAAHSY